MVPVPNVQALEADRCNHHGTCCHSYVMFMRCIDYVSTLLIRRPADRYTLIAREAGENRFHPISSRAPRLKLTFSCNSRPHDLILVRVQTILLPLVGVLHICDVIMRGVISFSGSNEVLVMG